MRQHRRISTVFALTLAATALASTAAARDNFLVIVADDLGVDATSVYAEGASPPATPELQELADAGVMFRHAYATTQCAPTRAQVLTGRHGFRTGIGVPGGSDLSHDETIIPEVLTKHHNAAIGKWHIGPGGDIDHPIDAGFDYYAGPLSNIPNYFEWDKVTNTSSTAGSTQTDYTTYATIDNMQEAIDKIAEFGDDPWFIWLAFTAPHGPFHVPDPLLETIPVDAADPNVDKYKAAIGAMDKAIGMVIDSMDPDVLADTTIIFLGDNGTPGGVSESPFPSNHAKGTVYEGGINVPLIIRSPHIDPADYGSESAALVGVVDIFATIADIAKKDGSSATDSISLLPYLKDPTLTTLPERPYPYAERFNPNGIGPYAEYHRAVRDDDYKLIRRDVGGSISEEFYHITAGNDPFEGTNLLPTLSVPEQAAYDALAAQITSLTQIVCPAAPDAGCTNVFPDGQLVWQERFGFRDRVVAKMLKGPALAQTDFGDPRSKGGTSYAMCFYDDLNNLLARTAVSASGELCNGRDCWKPVGGDPPSGSGYKYVDTKAGADGVQRLILRAGSEGKSKVILKGRGWGVPNDVTSALTAATSVTMQLHASDASPCATVTLTDIKRQDADSFKAK